VDGIASREVAPYSAAAEIMRRVGARMVASTVDLHGLAAPSRGHTES
jgi:hypothetical protein